MSTEQVSSAEFPAAHELLAICRHIHALGCSEAEWAERESDDEFQTPLLSGGYEATEGAFCFSVYLQPNDERWFTLSLSQAHSIAAGGTLQLQLRPPS